MILGLPLLDIAVICLYFAVVIVIGVYCARKVRDQLDYFLAGKRFGKAVQTFAAFGMGTNADTSVNLGTNVFVNGSSGVWTSLSIVFATPFYWFMAPWYQRLRMLTLGDFFIERYGSRKMAMIYAGLGAIGMMAIVALGFSALGKSVIAMTPKPVSEFSVVEKAEYERAMEMAVLTKSDFEQLTVTQKERLDELRLEQPRQSHSYLNETWLVYVTCLVVLVYGAAGGLQAAFLTDMLQGIFLIILSILLLPFAMMKVNSIYGGSGVIDAFSSLHTYLPESALELWGSPQAIDWTWYFLISVCIIQTLNVAIMPNMIPAIAAAKDEFTGRFGFVMGNLMKRVVTVLWGVFSLFALLLYMDEITNPDLVWGHATLDLLGPLNIGLVGLMIACLLSALMSTADALMITSSSLLTHNLYKELVPGKSEAHYVMVGRLFGILFIFGAGALALEFNSIITLLKFVWGFFAVFAAAFWLGMLWRRASVPAAWTSILTTAIVFLVLPVILPLLFPGMRTDEAFSLSTQSRIVERTYSATEGDIEREITIDGQVLSVGDAFSKTFEIPGRSVFWDQGIVLDSSGNASGKGLFNLDLWLLYKAGVPVDEFVYALNESMKFILRMLIPFGILILIAFLGKPKESPELEAFYVKLRTPVMGGAEKDAIRLAEALEHPEASRSKKLFPDSDWEFLRMSRIGFLGFLGISGIVALILIVATILM
jgi:SSS family solute:Na+ symporter